jgi:hypothetical protein
MDGEECASLERIILIKMKQIYIKLPLSSIPFSEIKLLNDIKMENIDCSYILLKEFNATDKCLISVVSPFQKYNGDRELMFGRVLSEIPQKRGVAKVSLIKEIDCDIRKEDLPHLKYSNNGDKVTGNWFYTKDGNYFIFSTIKSEYEKVKHLEGLSVYADNILRLRIVIELLKDRINERQEELSLDDFNVIAFKVLRSDPLTKRLSDKDILEGVSNWLPSMLDIPRFKDIPITYRERIED